MHLIIVGGGPGGYTAAFAAAKEGIEVTVVEAVALGGVCLHHGCIPTKTLRASADCAELARRLAEYGILGMGEVICDMKRIYERKNKVQEVLHTGLLKTCRTLGIKLVQGRATLLDAHHVRVETSAGSEELACDKIILATGSCHKDMPDFSVNHTTILDSDDALDRTELPKNLWIIGGGVIGCELACIYRALGSAVTIVQRRGSLLASTGVDKDVSSLLNREMRKQKIRVLTESVLQDVRTDNGLVSGKVVPSAYAVKKDAAPVPFTCDALLVTGGRRPNTEGLGLGEAGVDVDEQGWISVSDTLESSLAGVYAIGDVLGPKYVMLAHVAAMEGLCAVKNILGHPTPMDYTVTPAAIFTKPEIGYVGLSEEKARERGEIVAHTFQMRELGKSQASGELPGFLKVVADAATGRLLGAHMAGAHTTDMIAEAALAIRMKATVADIAHTIHAHPTLSEGFYEAARLAQEELDHRS